MAEGSILETFYFLFATDASGVSDGAKEAEQAAGRMEEKQADTEKAARKTEKAVKDTGRAAAQTAGSFAMLAKRAAAVLAPFIGLAALKGAVSEFASNADAAGKLAHALNMDIEVLQAWQGAAVRAGGSAEGMSASMKSLDGKLREMARGGGGDAGYALYALGISARDAQGRIRSADIVLGDLSGKFAGMSRQRALKVGEMLGLDEGTIELLRRGEKGVGELLARQKELGLYSKKDAEEARKFNNVMADMKQAFAAAAAVVVRILMPVFTAVSEGITTAAVTVRRHQNLITGFLIFLSGLLGVLAIKVGIISAPFLAVAAIVLIAAGAFAVLYDDVQAFLNGHDSMIGRLSKDYPWLGEMVREIADTFGRLWNIAKAVGELLVGSINDPAAAWEKFVGKIAPDIDALAAKFPELARAIEDLGAIFSWLYDLAVPIFKKIWEIVSGLAKEVLGVVGTVGGFIGDALHWVAGKVRGEEAQTEAPAAEPAPAPTRTPEERYPESPVDGRAPAAASHARQDLPAAAGSHAEQPPVGGAGPEAAAVPAHARAAAYQPGDAVPAHARATAYRPRENNDPNAVPMPGQLPPDTAANVARAKAALNQTDAAMAAFPPGAVTQRTEVHKNISIKVEQVTVETQAQDAQGISRDIGAGLEAQLRDLAEQYDDGVLS
jgi:hypothetical protein